MQTINEFLIVDQFFIQEAREKYNNTLGDLIMPVTLILKSNGFFAAEDLFTKLEQHTFHPEIWTTGAAFHQGVSRNDIRVSLCAMVFLYLYTMGRRHCAWTFLLNHTVYTREILNDLGFEQCAAIDLQNFLQQG